MGSHTRTLYLLKQTQGMTGIPSIHSSPLLHRRTWKIGPSSSSASRPSRICCILLLPWCRCHCGKAFSPEQKRVWGDGEKGWVVCWWGPFLQMAVDFLIPMFYCTSWVPSLNVAWIVVIFRFPPVINFLQTNIFVLRWKKQLRRFQPAKMFTKIQRHLDFFLLPKNGLAPFRARSTLEKEPLTGNFHQLETLKTQVSCCLRKMVRDVFVVGLCWRLTWGPVGSCWFKMVPPWSLTYPLKKLMVVKRSFLLGFVNFSGGKLLNFRGVLPLSATATHQDVIFFLISFHWKCVGSDNLLKIGYFCPSIDVLSSDNVPPRLARGSWGTSGSADGESPLFRFFPCRFL